MKIFFMQEFITFRSYDTIDEAASVAGLLRGSGLPVEIEQERQLLDNNFIGNNYRPKVNLRIPADCFKQAQEILLKETIVDIADIDPEYMLFSFSDEELREVIAKPDEWGYYNYNVALALLKERGSSVSAEEREKLMETRVGELSQQKRMSIWLILTAYATVALSLLSIIKGYRQQHVEQAWWFFPGIWGFLIGAALLHSKKTLPDGQKIPTYTEDSRKYGPSIMYSNLAAWLLNLVLFVYFTLR